MTLHRGGDDAPSGDEAKTARRREMNSALLRGVFQLALVVAFVGGAAFAVRWLMDTRPSAPQQAVAEPVYAVRATKAQAAVNQPSINVFGEVSARRSVELRALVAGKTAYVSEKLIVGQAVGAGDLLVSIDDFSYRGAMVEARANLAEATARLAEAEAQLAANEKDLERVREQVALAERDLTRARELGRRNTLSERTIDERELTLVQRRQQLEAAESAKTIQEARILQQSATMERLAWRVEQAERDLEDTALRAPFDAVVRSENVGLGKRLGVNDVVAQLYQADVLDVQFTLSDSQFGRLSSGAAPLLDRKADVVWAVGGAPIRAKATIERIAADVSSTTGGVAVLARVDQGERSAAGPALRPGAFVTVTLPDRAFAASYRLPEAALYDGDHVFALTPDSATEDGATEDGASRVWRLSRRPAQALAWDGPEVLVSGDLDGLWILTSRLAEAGEGVKVRLFKDDLAAPEAGADAAARPSAAAAALRAGAPG